MVEISKKPDKPYSYLNCAIVFSSDEQTYQDVIALISSVTGAKIFYTKSSRLRLVIEERGF